MLLDFILIVSVSKVDSPFSIEIRAVERETNLVVEGSGIQSAIVSRDN